MRGRALALVVAAWPLAVLAGHGDMPVIATQPMSFASSTPTEAQFLAGNAGTPATIGGELLTPVTAARLPVVVLVHGETGLAPNVRHWAEALNGMGLGVFLLDSFNGRGISETSTDLARLSHAAALVDAYRVLGLLAAHPRIDGRRIAVMGFSKGGWAALYASARRFQRLHGPKGAEFAAHLAFYPPCSTTYREDDQVHPRPIRVVHGTADDWHSIAPCRQYVTRLKRAGADAAMIELNGARHFFDLPDLAPSLRLPGVQRMSCLAEERANGVVNRATGRSPTREDCVRLGVTIGHDARAYEEALRRVKETLVAALGGG
ncbi:MAG: carboxymethylenebutenolidase [Candidatus Rokubacteria bacterium]|nr:carboxymethylenebutenolidase [Candidatus Rokubacteria bacterium]